MASWMVLCCHFMSSPLFVPDPRDRLLLELSHLAPLAVTLISNQQHIAIVRGALPPEQDISPSRQPRNTSLYKHHHPDCSLATVAARSFTFIKSLPLFFGFIKQLQKAVPRHHSALLLYCRPSSATANRRRTPTRPASAPKTTKTTW